VLSNEVIEFLLHSDFNAIELNHQLLVARHPMDDRVSQVLLVRCFFLACVQLLLGLLLLP